LFLVSETVLLELAEKIRSRSRLGIALGKCAQSIPRGRLSLRDDRPEELSDRSRAAIARHCTRVAGQRLPILHRHKLGDAVEARVPAEKIAVLDNWEERDLFTEKERVALAYAEAVTLRSDAIDEGLMVRLKKYFDDDAIVELTALIAFQNLSSKFNSALGVLPQGFCSLPQHK
jgi:alkylhydroperoxidase family enzyme